MLDLAVYNNEGTKVDTLKVDESLLGERVRHALIKQAIVMYHANGRVGTAATKGRSAVAGSMKKLFRQKGTGNARVGNRRTGKRVGGGVTFAKQPRCFGKRMPKKQKALARNSAVLAKILSDRCLVVDQLEFAKPDTGAFLGLLDKLKVAAKGSCLVTTASVDQNLYKSARNLAGVCVRPVAELNAGDICNHKNLIFTKEALLGFLGSN
jgi:large subunit ribosomal protein L4